MAIGKEWSSLELSQKAVHYYTSIKQPREKGGPRPLVEMPEMFLVSKVGEATVAEIGHDVWGGFAPYTGQPISDVETVTVNSSDAEDNPSGTGAGYVMIQGLDGEGQWLVEEVELDGTLDVATTHEFSRVFQTNISGPVGSNGTNVGTITALHTTTKSNVFTTHAGGQSTAAVFTVPAGYTAWISRAYASSRRGGAAEAVRDLSLAIMMRPQGEGWRKVSTLAVTNGSVAQEFPSGGIHVAELTDIRINIEDVFPVFGTDVSAGFDILCIKSSVLP